MADHGKTRKQLLDELAELRRRFAESEETQTACLLAEEAVLESELKFRSLAESAIDPIVCSNSEDEIIFWNNAATQVFGYTEQEIIGKPVILLIPERLREAHRQGIERYLRTRQPGILGKVKELTALRKDGVEFPIELSLSSWEFRGEVFFTGIIRDIGERKKSERLLQESTEEARRRTQELESLIQMVAHDLKSPVVTIGGLVRILERDLRGDNPDARRDMILEQLKNASTTLEKFLGDLLDGLVTEHIEPQLTAVSIPELAREIVHQHEGSAEERGITLLLDIADQVPDVLGDRHRIRQVLDNLVTNAMRHMGTRPDSLICIAVRFDADSVFTSVSDNGIGIPPEYHSKIFDRFFRIPRESGAGGTGLGLAIVKNIIERHGGRVWLESEAGQGATFGFTLPRGDTTPPLHDS